MHTCVVVIGILMVSVPIVLLMVVPLARIVQYVNMLRVSVLVIQIVIVVLAVAEIVRVILSVKMGYVQLNVIQMEGVVLIIALLINAKVINGVTILIVLRELVVGKFVPELVTVKAYLVTRINVVHLVLQEICRVVIIVTERFIALEQKTVQAIVHGMSVLPLLVNVKQVIVEVIIRQILGPVSGLVVIVLLIV
jgi:hypothetical protein